MSTKTQKISATPSDEFIRQQILIEHQRQPFYDFVSEKLGFRPFDYDVVLDQVDGQGWRVIDLKVFTITGDAYLSSIFLPPGRANRFPPALDTSF